MTARKAKTTPAESWMPLAVRYLARCDRTVAQIEQFLAAQGAALADVRATVARLIDLQYVNDRTYAERWVERRAAHRPMSRTRLSAELRAKGVIDRVADEAIAAVLRGTTEEQLARRALSQHQRRRGRRLTPARKVGLLRQRGFDEEIIARIISESDAQG